MADVRNIVILIIFIDLSVVAEHKAFGGQCQCHLSMRSFACDFVGIRCARIWKTTCLVVLDCIGVYVYYRMVKPRCCVL
jgi:hypothetical protein